MRSIFKSRLSLKARVGLGIAATAALVPVAAHAVVGGFSDVANGHTHAAGIEWVKNTGVTAGCTATTYCPDAPVTRAQMATFMQRLAGHAAGVAPSVDAATLGGLTAAQVAALGGGGGATPVFNPFAHASSGSASIGSGALVALPDASTVITIPEGFTATLEIDFAAESACYGTSYCSVVILVDGVEAAPASGDDFAFDSSDAGAESSTSWESHATKRIVTGLAAGDHTVEVMFGSQNPATNLRLDDWVLTAQAHLS